ncbi:uncharacterized protein METZ01_LOCUS384320, partial [marine metagenome]
TACTLPPSLFSQRRFSGRHSRILLCLFRCRQHHRPLFQTLGTETSAKEL